MSEISGTLTDQRTRSQNRDRIIHWKKVVEEHEQPHFWRATWQIVNSLGAYVAIWIVMYLGLSVSWWMTIPLAILAGGLLVRVFIIFHDCCHGSFFQSARANRFWGRLTGLLTFTPFYHWKWQHDVHHGTSGHLDKRGTGDIWTLTVEEYLAASRWTRFAYRVSRNPVVLFGLAPMLMFLVYNRFPHPAAKGKARRSVWLTNLALAAMLWGMILAFGWLPWLILQMTVLTVAGAAGVWLFYVQHQFEDAYWERDDKWDYTEAALKGSSFYQLPRVLQWFSGNIGFHHVHHLSHRIPNYNLERCHYSNPLFSNVKPLTLIESLRCLHFRLWDEATSKLITFRQLRVKLSDAAEG
ncbi:MAG: fatty acid desaturase [Verrucomicrobiae bacterium]|nr:fatty acid desaturase [Verrucomicrobiae bacterium]